MNKYLNNSDYVRYYINPIVRFSKLGKFVRETMSVFFSCLDEESKQLFKEYYMLEDNNSDINPAVFLTFHIDLSKPKSIESLINVISAFDGKMEVTKAKILDA